MKTIRRSLILLAALAAACASRKQPGFETADEAARQLVQALRTDDVKQAEEILGPESKDLLSSGDPVADKNGREKFVQLYDQKHRMEKVDDSTMTLCIGDIDWPVPIPIVRSGDVWTFDTAAGRDELINRRIGKNELSTIQVCLAYCDAQREYYATEHDGDNIHEYAQKFRSSPGKHDGLYWPAAEGEPQSPLGELAAKAVAEGYGGNKSADAGPQPYHGYYYRILKAQGSHAKGGAFSYLAHDRMIGGFALVAYPADYGNSGVMTFCVDHEGKVFQKDLGDDTPKTAKAMTEYDPDDTWQACPDSPMAADSK
jgi:hypothetical protein